MVIRTCEAEMEDSWMVTVVGLSMANSELDISERILGNMTKIVSYVVFDLDDSAYGYSCYGLNDGDRGRVERRTKSKKSTVSRTDLS